MSERVTGCASGITTHTPLFPVPPLPDQPLATDIIIPAGQEVRLTFTPADSMHSFQGRAWCLISIC